MTTPISLRYDFAENEQDCNPCKFVTSFLQNYYPGILGVENKNKYGEVIKKHFHYNFHFPGDEDSAKRFVATVRKRITRLPENVNRAKGYYSLTIPEVKDMERWLRYPLKQCETEADIFVNARIPPPADFDPKLQWRLASEEYVRDREFLSERREASDRKQSTFAKIIAEIERQKAVFKTTREIFDFVLEYYAYNEIPVERSKIRGMIDSLALKSGVLSADEYYRQVMA